MTPEDTEREDGESAGALGWSDIGQDTSGVPTAAQLAVALSILGAVFIVPQVFPPEEKAPGAGIVPIAVSATASRPSAPSSEAVAVEARAAFVWDVERQRAIYEKNADEELPLASLTKLMTALVASEVLVAGNRVAVTPEALLQEGESGFLLGETFAAEKLRDFMLISSSNDGAYALAAAAGSSFAAGADPAAAFVDAMNLRAGQLGLARTHYENPTGLDTDLERSGSYGSARDMALLMEFLLKDHPEVLEPTRDAYVTAETDYALHSATNTNEILPSIPALLGSKTGFTDLAGGNLVIAYDAGLNRPIIIAVLGSSREGRFRDTLTLIDYANRHLAAQ